jgi:hypothetical protein
LVILAWGHVEFKVGSETVRYSDEIRALASSPITLSLPAKRDSLIDGAKRYVIRTKIISPLTVGAVILSASPTLTELVGFIADKPGSGKDGFSINTIGEMRDVPLGQPMSFGSSRAWKKMFVESGAEQSKKLLDIAKSDPVKIIKDLLSLESSLNPGVGGPYTIGYVDSTGLHYVERGACQ